MIQPYDDNNNAGGGYNSTGSIDDPPDDDKSMNNNARDGPLGGVDPNLQTRRHRLVIFGLIVVALIAGAAIAVPMLLDDCDCPSVSTRALTFPPSTAPETKAPITPQTAAPNVPPTNAPTAAPVTSMPTATPSSQPSFAPTTDDIRQIIELVAIPVSGEAAVTDRSGAPYRAAEYLVTDTFSRSGALGVAQLRERYALIVFYYSMNGDNWSACSRDDILCPSGNAWLDNTVNHCTWNSVTCDANTGFVTGIAFTTTNGNNIEGPIPPEIGEFEFLTTLGITNDKVTGPLPLELNELTNLRELILTNNEIGGPISNDFLIGSRSSSLQRIYMSGNQLSGPIPASMGQFTTLIELILSNNQLDGVIPEQLNQMTNLGTLNLSNNNLRGALTSGVYILNLELLDLSNNPDLRDTLNGPALTNMAFLNTIRLANTNVGGNLPSQLFQRPIKELDLENADFSGPISSEFANLALSAQIINLSNNAFTGAFPDVFDDMLLLNELQVHGTDLTGEMSAAVCSRRGEGKEQVRVLSADCNELTCTCCTQCF